ncbi:MAG: DUF3300 domain-containing protein [Woeseiaceae bacterium]
MSKWKITDPVRLAPIAAIALLAATSLSLPSIADAQDTEVSAEAALLSANELDSLVAPLALYPDDLVAIMLPASTYPIQVVEAQRFLQSRDEDDDLEPDTAWDDAIVALLNYPEALQLLNDDLDWTWQLGEAVLAQQSDVLEAIESFRDEAFLAGNLASDEYQTVSREEDRIVIEPADPEVIYVPYYDPVEVVVRRPYRTYFYHDRGYPLYYYPYTVGHRFYRDPFFWGVSTAFSISWHNRFLHLNYFDTIRHPFYGHRYDSRRFFRHRFSRDYRVHNRNTGRFDRRGSHYRWYPNRFHGSRPGYSRNRTAQRQLTYNRNGYTRRSVNNRQRLNRNGRIDNRQQRRTASDRRRNDATANRSNSRFSANSRNNANDRRQRQNTASTNARSRLATPSNRSQRSATANDRQRQARTRQRDTGARANDRRAENSARPTQTTRNRTTTQRRQEQRSVGGPTKRQSVDRSSQRSRFSSVDRSRTRATGNNRQRATAPRANQAPRQAQSRPAQSRPAQSRPQRESRPSRSSASRERSRASSNKSRSRPSANRSRDRSSSKSRSSRRRD